MDKQRNKEDLLRQAAEAKLSLTPTDTQNRTVDKLTHELQLHQIELEMQNELLQQSQIALEESREHYVDIYEFAPDGYFTLTREGMIAEVNLTGAALLTVARNKLLNRRFVSFVSSEDIDKWHRHFLSVLHNDGHQSCELKLKRGNGTIFYARLDCLRKEINNSFLMRIALADITERKKLEYTVTQRNADLSELTAHIQDIAETERASLARELHDEMGSILAGLSMEVGRIKRKISDPDLLQDLSRVLGLISTASSIKQNIINQLYPTVLEDGGLVIAVNWLIKEYRKHSGIVVELVMPKEHIEMDKQVALAAYRITQECLTNIAKHANASRVDIEAKVKGGFLDLTIHDNGKGMPEEISINRHGIHGMIERARYLGGKMDIVSADGMGTTAHLILPLVISSHK